jgi:hypothetical protein
MNPSATLGRAWHVRRGVRLEWFTIIYNSLEGLIALAAGFLSGSIALVGFGFDSAIEVTSGAALLWRLRGDESERTRERHEAIALRIVGVCFLLLALYVSYDALQSLVSHEAPRAVLRGSRSLSRRSAGGGPIRSRPWRWCRSSPRKAQTPCAAGPAALGADDALALRGDAKVHVADEAQRARKPLAKCIMDSPPEIVPRVRFDHLPNYRTVRARDLHHGIVFWHHFNRVVTRLDVNIRQSGPVKGACDVVRQ